MLRFKFTILKYKIKTSFLSPESYNTVSCFLGNPQTLICNFLELNIEQYFSVDSMNESV